MGEMRARVLVVATLATAAGCGDGRTESPDAGADGTADEGLVSVRYLADASDLAGLLVYFQNADSTIALATRTDGEGRATGFMEAGGFVTVVVPNGNLWTYAGVAIGDDLVIDERTLETTEQRTTFMLRVPATTGADIYSLTTSCGSSDITGAQDEPTVATLGNCDGVTDLLILARSSEPRPFGSNYRYLYRKDVVLAGQDMIVVEGEYAAAETSTVAMMGAIGAAEHEARQDQEEVGREISATEHRVQVGQDHRRFSAIVIQHDQQGRRKTQSIQCAAAAGRRRMGCRMGHFSRHRGETPEFPTGLATDGPPPICIQYGYLRNLP